MLYEYADSGYRVFPLWPIQRDGSCGCGDPSCEQPGKHPRISNWQQVPHWSAEQIDVMAQHQQAEDHFGVVVDGFLVVDIDPRNGGNESYWRLAEDLGGEDIAMGSEFVVHTGGDGRHIYFALPDDGAAYVQALPKYPGIDFKTSGFVVGCGSLHASGKRYTSDQPPTDTLTPAPDALRALLRLPERHRTQYKGQSLDVSQGELQAILRHIDNSGQGVHYEDWIRVGMALHHVTMGAGFELWQEWSQQSDKHDDRTMDKKWHSFGKTANPVTMGTLVHYAQQGGYVPPVVLEQDDESDTEGLPFSIGHIDTTRPPGLVGELAGWIRSQCRYPRDRLAVAAAITAMGNVAGLRHTDDKDGVTLNLLTLCVAGSATGKEAVLQAMTQIHEAVSIQSAMVGGIKSEQEIVRNLTRHQAAFYVVDEIGYLLQKIESARKRGGAAYLDGVIAIIMSVYSKADGTFLITGDLKTELRKELQRELSECQSKIDSNEDKSGTFARRADHIRNNSLPEIDAGIRRPFLSMFGTTTPVSFDELVTAEQATNGFIGRCLLVREPETNPRRIRGFRKPEGGLPQRLTMALAQIHDAGNFEVEPSHRVEYYGERSRVPTEPEAVELLEDVADWLEDHAEQHKSRSGLEAIVRRSYEMVSKLSTILALGEGVRTVEHVKWAFAMALEDMQTKVALAESNIEQGDQALRVRVLDSVGDGEKRSTVRKRVSRAKQYTPEDADRMIDHLLDAGQIQEEERTHGRTGKAYTVLVRAGLAS